MPLPAISIDTPNPTCVDLASYFEKEGAVPALGSKEVVDLVYQPGACVPSGGALTGAVSGTGGVTFCCALGA
jgi:hypothetical protein